MNDVSQAMLGRVAQDGYRVRLVDSAYEQIKAEIEAGHIPPGSAVRERDLVASLNMSRTPVREALQRLRLEGFLVQLDGRYLVVELTLDEILNVYRVRGVLEGMAARQAAHNKRRTDVARLEDLLEEAAGAIERKDISAIFQANESFHDGIVVASRNSYLQAILQSVRRFASPYRRRLLEMPGLPEQVLSDHERLLGYVSRGDTDGAEAASRGHTRHTARTFVRGRVDPEADSMESLLRGRTELLDD